jgi:hypothetical protein
MSTTVAYVRMVGALLKDPAIGKRIVPIIADEARTFGMADLFRRSASTRPSASSTSPRTSTSSRTTRKRPRARSSRRASTRPARSLRGWRRRPATRRTRFPCCRCTSTTRCSASSAWATRSGPRPIHARAASSSAPPPGARRSRARDCSTRTARAT